MSRRRRLLNISPIKYDFIHSVTSNHDVGTYYILDFSVNSVEVEKEIQKPSLSLIIKNVLGEYLTNLKEVHRFNTNEGVLNTYISESGAVIHLRFYKNGLITLNIEYYKEEQKEPLLSFEKVKKLENDLAQRVNGKSRALVPLKRGVYPQYFPTSDERILEYDIDEIVFEEKSKFQKVQILHSKSLGNMLVLDDLQNISERDVIYTDTIMKRGTENYKHKEIIILGGGDGALLNELLKENPRHVIMLEIDPVVIKACAIHLRSLCGNVLDNEERPEYTILLTDCMVALDSYIKEGRKFDYVFGDLTDVPISDDPELWSFMEKVLQKVFKVMKPTGKFMTQVCGAVCSDALKKYEELLNKQEPKVKFERTKAFIPSFMEDWIFGAISFQTD
ncbi:hypothetical protein WA026_020474 [Henosepilachna vigintioctopunctata]|uniref:PABS domain-containing protein n=1 Tax=Henosepilachna vigintioctopunctata TaxID=420089 RepID=A0AAW1VJ17_9CUCU